MIDFQGRVALVTGAGRGLGLAYAKLLAERGAAVVLQDVGADGDGIGTDPEIAQRAAEELERAGHRAAASSGPIVTRSDCRRLVDEVLEAHGRLDVLIHNAGFVGYRPISEMDEAFLSRMTGLAVDASLWLAQAAWPAMSRQGYGRILLTTSDRGLYPEYAQAGLTAYAAAKAAVVGLANVLSFEGTEYNIVVNSISPVAKTRMWGIDAEPEDLRPDAVAPGAVFLVSEACTEGGWVLRASNGQFHAVRLQEAGGVDYPRDLRAVAAGDPDQVASEWRRIAPILEETGA